MTAKRIWHHHSGDGGWNRDQPCLDLGKMATGASALLKVMSGPAGWIALGVAGLAGLGRLPLTALRHPQKSWTRHLKALRAGG